MPHLNIKNEEAHRLASEIAERTGGSLTEVVLTALREQHARVPLSQEEQDEMRRRIDDHVERFQKDLGGRTLPDHDTLLYDPETGLPR